VLPTADADRFAIRELVENWALWRDAGDWERFATVWHPTEGWMTATWFQGPAPEFIAASRRGFESGVSILHFLGGHTADVAGDRAIAQTKMTISQRGEIDGVAVDVVCTGRFYDFCARHEGQWKIVRYFQTKAGFTVKIGLPGLTGEAVTRLYDEGAKWLGGSPAPGMFLTFPGR
jgi:hypothetical protein